MSSLSSDGASSESPPTKAECLLAMGSRRLWAYLLIVYVSLVAVSFLILLIVAPDVRHGLASLLPILVGLSVIFLIPLVSFGMRAIKYERVILSSDGMIFYMKSGDQPVRHVVCSVKDIVDVKSMLENIVKITYKKKSARHTESLCLQNGGAAKVFIDKINSARENN